jgi:hypothetical protein
LVLKELEDECKRRAPNKKENDLMKEYNARDLHDLKRLLQIEFETEDFDKQT